MTKEQYVSAIIAYLNASNDEVLLDFILKLLQATSPSP